MFAFFYLIIDDIIMLCSKLKKQNETETKCCCQLSVCNVMYVRERESDKIKLLYKERKWNRKNDDNDIKAKVSKTIYQ